MSDEDEGFKDSFLLRTWWRRMAMKAFINAMAITLIGGIGALGTLAFVDQKEAAREREQIRGELRAIDLRLKELHNQAIMREAKILEAIRQAKERMPEDERPPKEPVGDEKPSPIDYFEKHRERFDPREQRIPQGR